MFKRIKTLVNLTTPQYLLIALISPFSAYLIINNVLPSQEILPVIASYAFAILGFNIFNQISDITLDKVDKPFRPIIAKEISSKEALLISAFFYILSLLIALTINMLMFALIILFTLVSFFYSSTKLNVKRFVWSSSFTGMILYGLIPFLLAFSISADQLPIIFLLFFVALAGIYANFKDFEDMVGEQRFGIRSLPIAIGVEKAAFLSQSSIALLLLLMVILSLTGIIKLFYFYAAIISLAFFAVLHKFLWKELIKLKHKNIVYREYNNIEIKRIVTQSEAATLGMATGLLIQLIFGFFALTIVG